MIRRLALVAALVVALLVPVAAPATAHGYCARPAYTHLHGSYKYVALNYDIGSRHYVRWTVWWRTPLGSWIKAWHFTSGPC